MYEGLLCLQQLSHWAVCTVVHHILQLTNSGHVQVSDRAKKRGKTQLGTLGAGNHYVEVQVSHLTPFLHIMCIHHMQPIPHLVMVPIGT